MFYILYNICSSEGLSSLLNIIKTTLNLIQIVGPILSIISLIIIFIKLMSNPDDTKLKKALPNSIKALIILFLVPFIVNVTMHFADDSFSLSACWNSVQKLDERNSYIETSKKKPTKVGPQGEYELGEKSSANGAGVETALIEAKKIADYVRTNNFSYGNAPINPAINHEAKLVSCDRFVGWVLYNIGYTDQPREYGLTLTTSSSGLRTWCESHNFTKITDQSSLQAGDIVFVNPLSNGHPGHVYLLGNKVSDGLWERYDCGSNTRIHSQQPFKEGIGSFMFAYRFASN